MQIWKSVSYISVCCPVWFSSVQFSRSVVSDSLQPSGLQRARLPCPSPTPRACSDSCPSMPSNRLILCHPLLLLPSIFPSIKVFSNKSVLRVRWPEYWSFSFSISPSNEYWGLIFFRMDWLDLLAVQGTLKSLLNTTVQKHQFFGAQSSLWSRNHMWLLERKKGETYLGLSQLSIQEVTLF